MRHFYQLVLTSVVIAFFQTTLVHSWGWFSSSSKPTIDKDYVAEFSVESVNSKKALDKARQRLSHPDSCWHTAYDSLLDGCTEIMNDEQKRSRFAWHLSDCFQRMSGSPPFPYCDKNDLMSNCLKKLDERGDERARSVHLKFFMETSSLCHQLQADVFKKEVKRLVNNLKDSAEIAEETLENIEEKTGQILKNSNQVQSAISSLDSRMNEVSKTTKEVGEQIDVVLDHAKVISEQTRAIAAYQLELQGGQNDMKEKLETGTKMLEESHRNLGLNVGKVKQEVIVIEKGISEVSNAMSSKMQNLQKKADDIGNIAGVSLDNQKLLLDGQAMAHEGLDFLTKFQSQAQAESKAVLQKLVELGRKQQDEQMRQQEQMQLVQDHLAKNSRYILEAQEAFESKQANMLMTLEKLFILHNSYSRESHIVKSFFFYLLVSIVIYVLTSTKQTHGARVQLYLGLSGMFLAEFVMISGDDLNQQSWFVTKICLARTCFLALSSFQIIYSCITYKDYEVLNYTMLQKLIEKVHAIENRKLFEEEDDDISSWVDTYEDCHPDYLIEDV